MSIKSLSVRVLTLLIFASAPALLAATTPPLVGSWEFTVAPAAAATLAAALPLEGLATFTSDGTVVETDTGELVTLASPGHGIWQNGPIPPPVGYQYVKFTSLIPNANGTLHSKRIVTMLIAVDSAGTQFTGTWEYEIVNPKGAVIASGTGTVTGDLMVHPLLP